MRHHAITLAAAWWGMALLLGLLLRWRRGEMVEEEETT